MVRVDGYDRFVIEAMNLAATGIVPQEYQGQAISQLIGSLANDGNRFVMDLFDALTRVVATNHRIEYQATLILPATDHPLTFEIRLSPSELAAKDGYILVFMRDVSAHKLRENELAAKAQEFQLLVEKLPDTIARYNLECERTYANPAFQKLKGTTLQNLAQHCSCEYCGAEYVNKLHDVLASGRDDEIECTWVATTGNTITSQILLVPDRDAHGEITGILSIGRDITTLKETERYLRESRTLLRELTARRESEDVQVRKELARKMHEEYGQLLGALRMKLALLSMRFGKTSPYLQQEIEDALVLLDGTILHMRDIASSMHPHALNMGIQPALEWLAEQCLSSTKIKYHVHVDDAPEGLDDVVTSHLFKIVQFALSNVLLHAEATNVDIKLEAYGDGLRLEVRDDGKGFDLNRSKSDSMGMVAMEELSNMLGGEIVFLSEPGKGTVVEVILHCSNALLPA